VSPETKPATGRTPLVSVILAVRDREDCVARAIRSVLAQTYAPVELIVVDDGSSDGTAAVARAFEPRLTLIPIPPTGVYAARNIGLRAASGDLVAFIDSDDSWFPDKLAAQVPLMRPQVGLVYGDTVHVTAPRDGAPRNGLTSFRVAPPARGRAAAALAWCNFVPTCTVLARRSLLEATGGFSEAQPLSADYLAWFRIALRAELDFVPRPVADYTVHSDGISHDLGRALAARIALFEAELRATDDPAVRALLRRTLFNLSLHLALAGLRGRARSVRRPVRKGWRTGLEAARLHAGSWAAAFVLRQARTRARRLFA
jgi:glycosyltransferase involved in cell wall biosynthesis